jgi:glycosyltransferase involved in cell wall biosynthesis
MRALGAGILGRRSPSSQTPGMPPRGIGEPFERRAQNALDALPQEESSILIAYTPLVRNNPYQAMLYSTCWERGIAAVPIEDLIEAGDLPRLAGRAHVWLHMHWTSAVLARAGSQADARRRLDRLQVLLDRSARADIRIAWTVHNVLPHERRFHELEVDVCRILAERADLIHVLHEKTVSLTEPYYQLPRDKVRVVPHASYLGVYPNVIGRVQARYQLGVPPRALTFCFVGAVRRYKGIDRLIDAFSAVFRERGDARLLLAGPGLSGAEVRRLSARARAVRGIITRLERIPEWDLQIYLNAADVVVLPYEEALNSGALMLAFTFGRPVIASRRGLMTDLVTEDVGVLFDPDEPAGLERALRSADRLIDPQFAEATRARADQYTPRAMADDFATLIRRWPSR